MEIIGYKCFNEDFTNRYGEKFEVGKTYNVSGEVKFGSNGNGFHFCKNIEDTFRYFDTKKCLVCLVKGEGVIDTYEDEYNGFYDMYSAESIEILKKLSREEIINIGLNLKFDRLLRFIQLFKLNKNEIDIFIDKFKNDVNVLNYIKYYQLNDKEAFKIKKYV